MREKERIQRNRVVDGRKTLDEEAVLERERISETSFPYLHLSIYCLFFSTVRVLVFSIKEIRENV